MTTLLAVGGASSGGGGKGPGWALIVFLIAFVLIAIFIASAVLRRRSR